MNDQISEPFFGRSMSCRDSAAPPHLSLGRNWIIAMYSEALRDLTPLASKTHLQIDTYSVPSSKALKNDNVE